MKSIRLYLTEMVKFVIVKIRLTGFKWSCMDGMICLME